MLIWPNRKDLPQTVVFTCLTWPSQKEFLNVIEDVDLAVWANLATAATNGFKPSYRPSPTPSAAINIIFKRAILRTQAFFIHDSFSTKSPPFCLCFKCAMLMSGQTTSTHSNGTILRRDNIVAGKSYVTDFNRMLKLLYYAKSWLIHYVYFQCTIWFQRAT